MRFPLISWRPERPSLAMRVGGAEWELSAVGSRARAFSLHPLFTHDVEVNPFLD